MEHLKTAIFVLVSLILSLCVCFFPLGQCKDFLSLIEFGLKIKVFSTVCDGPGKYWGKSGAPSTILLQSSSADKLPSLWKIGLYAFCC